MESGTRAQNLFQCRAEPAACGNPGFLLQIGREWLLVLLLLLLGGRRKNRLLSDATGARSLMEDTSIHSDAILAEGLFCQYVLVPMLRYFTQSEKSQKPYKSTKLTQAMILKFLKTFLKYQIEVDAPKTPLDKH